MGFFGELGEFAKGAFNAMKESSDKYRKSYDSSSDMSDESSIIKFGYYFKNDNKTEERIEWRVLEVSKNKALLITKDAIDCKPYNNERRDITWENCTLRRWLNYEFINQAFSKEEQKEIIKTNISNPDNARYGTNGGNNTYDRIFLLSLDEAQKYFKKGKDRECNATMYAQEQKYAVIYKYKVACHYGTKSCWWLRSPGGSQNYAAYVSSDGDFGGDGNVNLYYAVRPALWINL